MGRAGRFGFSAYAKIYLDENTKNKFFDQIKSFDTYNIEAAYIDKCSKEKDEEKEDKIEEKNEEEYDE